MLIEAKEFLKQLDRFGIGQEYLVTAFDAVTHQHEQYRSFINSGYDYYYVINNQRQILYIAAFDQHSIGKCPYDFANVLSVLRLISH